MTVVNSPIYLMDKVWMVVIWQVQVNLHLLNPTSHFDQKEEWDYYGALKRSARILLLKVDWNASRVNNNSGIVVRFSNPDNDPLIAVNTGYEIQIDDMAMSSSSHLSDAVNSIEIEKIRR